MASSRRGGMASRRRRKLNSRDKADGFVAFMAIPGDAQADGRSRMVGRTLPARWSSEFRGWSVMAAWGSEVSGRERVKGKKEKRKKRKKEERERERKKKNWFGLKNPILYPE